MPKPDDFDLIPRQAAEPEPEVAAAGTGEPRTGRSWGWVATLIVVAFLFFAIGAGIFTLRERLGGAPEPTPRPPTATPAGTPMGFVATLVALASTTPTLMAQNLTPVATATPSPFPTLTPTPAPCGQEPAAAFAAIYRREVFGCALSPAGQIVWAAWEPFERGSLLWRSDTNRSYLFTLGGVWQVIDASWDGQTPPGRGEPPAGLHAPERGFGWVWSTQDDIFQALGWARDAEKGFCAEIQEFEQGFMLRSDPAESCTAENLYNHASAADWPPMIAAAHQSGVWSGALGGGAVVAPAPTRVVQAAARPAENGTFRAQHNTAIQLDGDVSEWPATSWSPIDARVEGVGSWDGPADLLAVFQTAWTDQGLLVAAQVQDDHFSPGPQGTNMWQGDALELQFDARLVDDYGDASANEDDFQIGIAIDRRNALQLYRWLPLAMEGPLPAYGIGEERQGGYVIEALLPWSVLGVESAAAGDSFGFNLSVSDNDGVGPSQETVLSASPARTTYDDPTEWGTLLLAP